MSLPATSKSSNIFRYKVIEKLAEGGSALVEWRLETGRTHQVQYHMDS